MVAEDFPIEVEQRGGVAIWTISRELRANSLSKFVLFALGRLAKEAAQNRSIRAIVLTGAGEKYFCAGADLKERANMSQNQIREQLDLYRRELKWLDESPKPILAAVNGLAFGGGLELALCCDLRIAHEHSTFAFPETSLGIIPGAGGTQRLSRVIGEARAKEMILLCHRLSSQKALDWGLVHEVIPSSQNLIDASCTYLDVISKGAPIAQASALRAIDAARSLPLDLGLEVERLEYEKTLVSQDRDEGLLAFLEKRKAVFTGS